MSRTKSICREEVLTIRGAHTLEGKKAIEDVASNLVKAPLSLKKLVDWRPE